jgi:hypothetical protein
MRQTAAERTPDGGEIIAKRRREDNRAKPFFRRLYRPGLSLLPGLGELAGDQRRGARRVAGAGEIIDEN